MDHLKVPQDSSDRRPYPFCDAWIVALSCDSVRRLESKFQQHCWHGEGLDRSSTERPGAVQVPGFWRTDLAMFKNIKFTERFTGQLRAETLNTFNRLNPICCASFTTSSSSFDKVASTRDPRTMQFALKLLF